MSVENRAINRRHHDNEPFVVPPPYSLFKGDSFKVCYGLPTNDDDADWTAATLALNQITSEDNAASATASGTVETAHLEIRVSTTITAALATGTYRWAVYVSGDEVRQTVAKGLIDINDLEKANLDHDMKMVSLLELALEAKMDRGDVIRYEIGDRTVETMSLNALHMELNRYRDRISYKRKPRRFRPM